MAIIESLSKFSPTVQVVFLLGCFTTILMVAYSRTAGDNLLRFLRKLLYIFPPKHAGRWPLQYHYRSQEGKKKQTRIKGKSDKIRISILSVTEPNEECLSEENKQAYYGNASDKELKNQ